MYLISHIHFFHFFPIPLSSFSPSWLEPRWQCCYCYYCCECERKTVQIEKNLQEQCMVVSPKQKQDGKYECRDMKRRKYNKNWLKMPRLLIKIWLVLDFKPNKCLFKLRQSYWRAPQVQPAGGHLRHCLEDCHNQLALYFKRHSFKAKTSDLDPKSFFIFKFHSISFCISSKSCVLFSNLFK